MPIFSRLKTKSSNICSLTLLTYSAILAPATLYFTMTGKILLIEWEILSASTALVTLPIILDPVSLSFSNLVCFISGCVMMFSSYYMSSETFLNRFCSLVMLFVMSMNLLVFIPSLISLLLGWDGLGITSFALVVYYQNYKSLSAGMVTALVNRIGDVMILLAAGLCISFGHWNITLLWTHPLSSILATCIILAAMTKSAQIPFSSWLPAAMAAPTPVSALVHSSTLVTAGVFLLIRFFPLIQQFPSLTKMLLFTAMLTMFMSGINAMNEYDMKKIIALSTLSQLSVMMFSLGLHAPMLALFHLYTHAMFKAMLFLCAGTIIHNNNDSQDLRHLGGLSAQLPLSLSSMNLANFTLCGAPFLSGFYSKDAILEFSMASQTNLILIMTVLFATGLTTAYSLRLSIYTLWAQKNHMPTHSNSDENMAATSPIMALAFMSVTSGNTMQLLLPEFNIEMPLPFEMKTLTMLVITLGAWFAALPWATQTPTYNPTWTKFFNSLMWFLAPLATQPTTKHTLATSSLLMNHLDSGWVENIAGKGVIQSVATMAKQNQLIQKKPLTTTLTAMMITMLLLSYL
uniref:NADH-ubiquinone oxidoreductase chain 5 n=1 Tax=Diodora graeca TaxID=120387 RepID=A0A120HD48_DIOGA|nr:NADH dehydrogenase subunit 5 [Diodora graeca]